MRRLLGRKFLPLYVILVLLVLAFAAPIPSLMGGTPLLTLVGFNSGQQRAAQVANPNAKIGGYGNNCGIKGDGTPDHGKTCPNYP